MGRPREFFNVRSTILPIASKHGLLQSDSGLDLRAYLAHITGTYVSPNGVFGMKVLFSQLSLAMQFRCVRQLLGEARYVWLMRRDVVAQAVSGYIASELQAWSHRAEERRREQGTQRADITYDRESVRAHINRYGRHNFAWLEFFSVNGLDFIPIAYEDLLANPTAVCRAVCDHCGVATDPDFAVGQAKFQKQRDALNQHLWERFAAESSLALDGDRSTERGAAIAEQGLRLFESPSGRQPTRNR